MYNYISYYNICICRDASLWKLRSYSVVDREPSAICFMRGDVVKWVAC